MFRGAVAVADDAERKAEYKTNIINRQSLNTLTGQDNTIFRDEIKAIRTARHSVVNENGRWERGWQHRCRPSCRLTRGWATRKAATLFLFMAGGCCACGASRRTSYAILHVTRFFFTSTTSPYWSMHFFI